MKEARHLAFIDGQNLYLGTTQCKDPWRIDLRRFYIYLTERLKVKHAYYFLGYVHDDYQNLYEEIQKAGFILMFKKHNPAMKGAKKGNVDTDIVFHIMKHLYQRTDFRQVVLVSGDGDYKILVDFLIQEQRFKKILFPEAKRASSLYKQLGNHYTVDLSREDLRQRLSQINLSKEKGA